VTDTLQPGATIGQYQIRAKVGAGGMGEVYRAHDSRLRRDVAIKVLPRDFAGDYARLQRFEQEARATSALNHPNILTVHDIGAHDGAPFIVSELLEGEELRGYLKRGPLPRAVALDYTQQIAAGLAAAHARGIVHRDLKPENVFVTSDGFVKILDFGLAKLTEVAEASDASATTSLGAKTMPGAVMGTAGYMSPEQARGGEIDARSDIFSLGVVLYEMVAGRTPFTGANTIDVLGAILNQEPPPLRQFAPDVPASLERLIAKAIRKDPGDRYQSVKDLQVDLKAVRDELTTGKATAPATAVGPSARRSRLALVAAALVVLALAGLGGYFYFNRAPILTDKDTILLAEFENKTGEAVFDGTLRQGLTRQLQQTPFLDLFPDAKVRSTLRLMTRSPDDRLTRDVALQLCQRQGLKAYIVGTIAKFERNYSITLEALNGQTGDVLGVAQVEAEGKDQVLRTLTRAATELRGKLGESLASLQKFDAKLEATTSSLEALQEYAQGQEAQLRGRFQQAADHARRAIAYDPNFAIAWLQLTVNTSNLRQIALAADYAAKAYALRDRASVEERARIEALYYQVVTGELDELLEARQAYVRDYPRAVVGQANLGAANWALGRFEQSLSASREAIRLDPNYLIGYANAALSALLLNRFDEARDLCRQALARQLQNTTIHGHLFNLALVTGDAASMQEQVAWGAGQPDAHSAMDWQLGAAAFEGAWRRSEDFLGRGIEMAARAGFKEVAATYASQQAVRAAWIGRFDLASSHAEAALKLEHNRSVLTNAALAFGLSGAAARVPPLIAELEQRFPKDTRVNELWLPIIRAASEVRKGDGRSAITQLERSKRLETIDDFQPQFIRGMAYLALGKGAEAAAEYRKIIDHRGQSLRSVLWPLAHLGMGRARVLSGDTAGARQMYDQFFTLWKNADADLPVLIQAKEEYARLR
jgi:tetratricopeptide (TPR) repeat protein